MRLGDAGLALEIRAHDRDVGTRLASVDIGEHIIPTRGRSLGCLRCEGHVLDHRRLGNRCGLGGRYLRLGFLLGRRRQRLHRLARRQSVGARQDRSRIVHFRAAGFELVDELRQSRNRAPQCRQDRLGACQSIVEQAVQEILDRPGELRERTRAHHAPAAL